MDQIRNYFNKFLPLTDGEWGDFAACLKKETHEKRRFLLQQGESCNYIAFIGEGIYRFYYVRDGEEKITAFFFPGDFVTNYALTFGYRQFFWKGLHAEIYQAIGPGFNRENVIDGRDYSSWDYELGLLVGYRWELFRKEKREKMKYSPYLSTQHGFYYLAAQSNPHPIRSFEGEEPFYVGTLNLGIRF